MHCCKERTYFFCVKKCGNIECTTCKAVRCSPDVFEQLHDLPDPTPSLDNEGHYMHFNDIYGSDTSEKYKPSLVCNTSKGHQIPFNPVKQHVLNTRLKIECSECCKPRLVYSKFKITKPDTRAFKNVMDNVLYTCGASLTEFPANENQSPVMEKLFVRRNLTCLTPVEALYYSSDIYPECCSHCGSRRRLRTVDGHFPICSPCTALKKQPIHRRKRVLKK